VTSPDPPVYPTLTSALQGLNLHEPYTRRRVAGGDINQTSVLEDSQGTRLFLKEHPTADIDHFSSEFDGLRALGQVLSLLPRGLGCPRPLALGTPGQGGSFLLLEYVEPGRGPKSGDWLRVGVQLGEFYRASANHAPATYGYHRSNRIGSTVQINTPEAQWGAFFARHRIDYLRELLAKTKRISNDLDTELRGLASRLPEILPSNPLRVLVHGDLWRGNFMFNTDGRAFLIDPGVYWGTAEVDLAMAELFGGFPGDFFSGVAQVTGESPVPQNREVYRLYHLLNHLLLFGSGYLGGGQEVLRSISNFS